MVAIGASRRIWQELHGFVPLELPDDEEPPDLLDLLEDEELPDLLDELEWLDESERELEGPEPD